MSKIKLNKCYLMNPFIIFSILYVKSNIFQYILFLLFFIPFIFYFIKSRKIPLRYFLLISFLLIQFSLSLISSSLMVSIKNIAQYILNIVPIIIYDYSVGYLNSDYKFLCSKSYVKISTIFFTYCFMASFMYVQTNIYALRNLATERNLSLNGGVFPLAIGGGYPLIFSSILLAPFLLFIGIKVINKRYLKIIFITLSVFIEIFIIEANNTTAVLVSILGFILVFFSGNKRNYIKWILGIGAFVIVFLLNNQIILENIINFLADIFDQNSIIRIRLLEIVPALYAIDQDSSFGLRLKGYAKSWNSFITYPFEGVGVHSGYNYLDLANHLGWHCEWIDMLAEFGILLTSLYLLFIYFSFKKIYKNFKYKNSKKIYAIMGILFIVMGFLDPILNGNMVLVLFLVIPCALNIIEYKMNKR